MGAKPALLDCEAILSEMPWLRRLAKSLGASADLADDLTQATMLSALEHPPDMSRPVKGWLRTVLRNLFHESARKRLRREAREAHAARRESSSADLDVIGRAAVQKRVMEAVMGLEEPYRTTVLLRFFEGLPPRRIAERTGTPVATVKTRLARALEQLRGRLDHEHGGDRRAWLACLLAPLPKAAVTTSLIGVTLVQAKLKVALIAAVALVGAAGWLAFDRTRGDRTAVEAPHRGDALDERAKRAPAETSGGLTSPIRPRPSVDNAETGAPATAPAAPGAASVAGASAGEARIRGRVIDTRSSPVAAIRVVFTTARSRNGSPESTPAAGSPTAISGPDGVFEMAAPPASGSLLAQSPTHATVLSGTIDLLALSVEPVIVVAPIRRVAGRVVDGERKALPGAVVTLELPHDFRSRFDRVLDYSEAGGWLQQADQEGRFAFESAPEVEGARLGARLEGYEDSGESPIGPSVEIVLQPIKPRPGTITGRVVNHEGTAVQGARVATRDHTTKTDERGLFTLKIDEQRVPPVVMALKDGFLPAAQTLTAETLAAPIVLKIDGSPLSIAGKVVDKEGKALGGIKVWTADPTLFASAEDGIQFVESMLGNPKPGFWVPITTEEDGRFVLRGLLPRDYKIHAMDPKTLALEEAVSVAAGSTGVVITLPDEVYETVAGTVVSLGGAPLGNVKVNPQRDVFHFKVDEGGSSTRHADIAGAVTDAQGRFTLRRVPAKGVYLRIDGTNVIPREFGREEGLAAAAGEQGLAHLRIEVSARCHIQVDLTSQPGFADQVSILDPSGNPMSVELFLGSGRMTSDRAAITDGRTSVLAVPENTTTVVFSRAGREVARKRVALVPGTVTTVTP